MLLSVFANKKRPKRKNTLDHRKSDKPIMAPSLILVLTRLHQGALLSYSISRNISLSMNLMVEVCLVLFINAKIAIFQEETAYLWKMLKFAQCKERIMLLERMTYNYDKMQRNQKYGKWLSHSRGGAGDVVGFSIGVWVIDITIPLIFVASSYEWSFFAVKCILLVCLAFIVLGFVLGCVLEYKLDHNKLKKGSSKLSDKEIRKINFYFVIMPYIILLFETLGLIIYAIICGIQRNAI